jgi:steroid delta-isomerase-like uncharacterized protein
MNAQDNIKVVRQSFDAWNSHDPERYLKLIDEKFVFESDTIPSAVTGREATRQLMAMYLNAFPDLHFEIAQVIAEGDFVVTRYRATGTHRGELMSVPATNRKAVVNGCTVSQLKSGKISHQWVYWDTGHLLRQLGVVS